MRNNSGRGYTLALSTVSYFLNDPVLVMITGWVFGFRFLLSRFSFTVTTTSDAFVRLLFAAQNERWLHMCMDGCFIFIDQKLPLQHTHVCVYAM